MIWVIMRRRGVSSERRRSSCSSYTKYDNTRNMIIIYKHSIMQCCPQAAAAGDIADYCHVTLLSQSFLKITYINTGNNRLLFRLLYQNHWLLKFLGTTLSMMSWHGNAFHVTTPFLGESTSHWWVLLTMGQWQATVRAINGHSTTGFGVFLDFSLYKMLNKQTGY